MLNHDNALEHTGGDDCICLGCTFSRAVRLAKALGKAPDEVLFNVTRAVCRVYDTELDPADTLEAVANALGMTARIANVDSLEDAQNIFDAMTLVPNKVIH